MDIMMSLVCISVVFGQFIAYLLTKLNYRKYPRVLGRIVKAKLDDHNGVYGNRTYRASFEVEYEYQDKLYVSHSPILRCVELFPSFQYESKLLDSYKVGDIVEVRVNPIEPNKGYFAIAPLSIMSFLVMLSMGLLAVFYFMYLKNLDSDKLLFELHQWRQNTY